MRIVDLSATIASSPPDASLLERVDIHYTSHAKGAAQIQAMLHVRGHLLRNGEGSGIDAWGGDGPLDRQTKEALAIQKPGVFWATHQADLAYSQIKRLVKLGSLPLSVTRWRAFRSKSAEAVRGPPAWSPSWTMRAKPTELIRSETRGAQPIVPISRK
jgi:hypothetical protein